MVLHPIQHKHRGGGLANQAEALALGVLGTICAAAPEGQQAETRLQAEAPLDEGVAAAAVVVVESIVKFCFSPLSSVT